MCFEVFILDSNNFKTMFDYTKKQEELVKIFNPQVKSIPISGSKVKINNVNFESTQDKHYYSVSNDLAVEENRAFSYPVFVPENRESKKVILLFHGLNERSWEKYLSWAYCLSEELCSYVVLFPISFHINRTPLSWREPRATFNNYTSRKEVLGEIEKSSLANVTLSNRLCEKPLRFFSSGYQTMQDVSVLVESIYNGSHQVIPQTDNVDVFAYSIGAFMAEILMMGNPKDLFAKSKLFIFCGGSVFSNMNGVSKFIMDKLAYENVYNYYVSDFERQITPTNPCFDFLNNTLGIAFRSMISFAIGKEFREKTLKHLKEKLKVIALAKDKVIPVNGILETLQGGNVSVTDFPYNYSHESPFPVFKNEKSREVDHCFDNIFSQAVSFFKQ